MASMMKYGNLGRSGLKLSRVGIGSWLTYGTSVEKKTAAECIQVALDGGVVFVDTADIYALGAAETVLGEILQDLRRQDLVLASKAYWPMSDNINDRGLSRKHLFESVENSLRRLRTDYIDLYQCHRFDSTTPMEEIVRAMDDLIHQGKILYWGVSCWTAEQIADAVRTARLHGVVPPVSNQPPYNMLDRGIEADVIPRCAMEGMSQVVFSPLAQGLLTGKYSGAAPPAGTRAADEHLGRFLRPLLTEENLQKVEQLKSVAQQLTVSLAQLALAWNLRLPNVTSVIIGATRPEQVTENLAAVDLQLTDEVIEMIEQILQNKPEMRVDD